MPKLPVAYRCGHTIEQNLKGKEGSKEFKDYFARMKKSWDCADCRAAGKVKAAKAAEKAATAKAKADATAKAKKDKAAAKAQEKKEKAAA